MNFFAQCYELFQRISDMSDVHDLKKDVENYRKLQYYKMNFNCTNRKDIEQFIFDVRCDNDILTAIRQAGRIIININGPLRRLDELPLPELYNELCGEEYNIVLKGAYDSVKVLNELTDEQDRELQNRFANEDTEIFVQYKCR